MDIVSLFTPSSRPITSRLILPSTSGHQGHLINIATNISDLNFTPGTICVFGACQWRWRKNWSCFSMCLVSLKTRVMNSIIMIESQRIRGKQGSLEKRYYLSS